MPGSTESSRLPSTAGLAGTGEVVAGLAVLAFPGAVMGFVLAAPVDGAGVLVARMLGITVAAMGLSWWVTRGEAEQRPARSSPSFLAYNLGVGLLFLVHAVSPAAPGLMPWLVAGLHLLVGLLFCLALLVRRRSA